MNVMYNKFRIIRKKIIHRIRRSQLCVSATKIHILYPFDKLSSRILWRSSRRLVCSRRIPDFGSMSFP